MFTVFDIQKFSYHDGPGVRTTVFLKGCNLKCFWCQNPESQCAAPQLLYFKNNCIHCGTCLKACPNGALSIGGNDVIIARTLCKLCGTCEKACPTNSLKISGRLMTDDEIIKKVLEDTEMYQISGGGVTFSGGEPLIAPGICGLLKKFKELGVDTAIETAGLVKSDVLTEAAKYTDHFMYDIKSLDEKKHMEACGASSKKIAENLRLLCKIHNDILVRVPVIPGFNDNEKDIADIAKFVKGLGLQKPQLLRFNKLGLAKYNALSRKYEAADLELLEDEHFDSLVNTADEIFHDM